ncbi:hypothetical protein BDQ17DRAFT_776453 [Cyathus striatus]|nr:hypothetical protein BDQ17DRAFT_776453 [Cyathus striatus]
MVWHSRNTTFINALFNGNVTAVGDNRGRYATTKLKPIIHPCHIGSNSDRRFIVVDTPGFDEPTDQAIDLLARVSVWLEASYNAQMKVAGFIYIRDISTRATWPSPPSRKLRVSYRKLAGGESLSSIILATTQWSDIEDSAGNDNLYQLKRFFWRDFDEHGSAIVKFSDTHESAVEIVDLLLKKHRVEPTGIFFSFESKSSTTIRVATRTLGVRTSDGTSGASPEDTSGSLETEKPVLENSFTYSEELVRKYQAVGAQVPTVTLPVPPSIPNIATLIAQPNHEMLEEQSKEQDRSEYTDGKDRNDHSNPEVQRRLLSADVKQQSNSASEVVEFEAAKTQSSFYKASGFTMNGTSMIDSVAPGASLTIHNHTTVNYIFTDKETMSEFLPRLEEDEGEKEGVHYHHSDSRHIGNKEKLTRRQVNSSEFEDGV